MLIAQENLYGGGSEGFAKEHMVITDATTWQNVMNQMNSVNTVTESFVETDIDFDAYQIIAAFDEVKGNGGHLLEIRLMPGPDQVSVSILDSAPQGNATTVITQPFCILKMTKTDLPIVFE